MGNEEKRVFELFPEKILNTNMCIHNDTRDTVVQRWKMNFFFYKFIQFSCRKISSKISSKFLMKMLNYYI